MVLQDEWKHYQLQTFLNYQLDFFFDHPQLWGDQFDFMTSQENAVCHRVPWHFIINSPELCSIVRGSSSMKLIGFFFFLCSFIELQLQSPLLAHVKCCIIFLKCTLKNCTSLSKPQSCLYSASGECFLIFFSFFGPGLYIFFSVPCQILNIIAHMFCFKMSLGQKPALVFWLPVLDSSYHLFFDVQVLIFLSTPWCILKCF